MLLLALFWTGICLAQASEDEIYEEIISDQHKIPYVGDNPIVMNIGLSIQFVTLVDKDEQVQLSGSIFFTWIDPRLKWSPAVKGFVVYVSVLASSIWIPSVIIENLITPLNLLAEGIKAGRARVYHDGRVTFTFSVQMKVRCHFNLDQFPYDFQVCSVRFFSWILPKTRLVLKPAGAYVDTSFYSVASSWRLTGSNATSFQGKTFMFEETTGVEFFILLQRGNNFFIINIVAPCVLLSIVAIISILVPPNSGEKVTLCMTTHVSYFIFLLFLAEHMPWGVGQTSTGLKYVCITMITSSCTVAVEIVIMNIYYMGELGHQPPECLMTACESYLRYIVFVDSFEVRSGNVTDIGASRTDTRPDNERTKPPLEKHYTAHQEESLLQAASSRQRRDGYFLMCMARPKFMKQRSSIDNIETTALLSELVDYLERFHANKQINRQWVFIALVIERILFLSMVFILLVESWAVLGWSYPKSSVLHNVNFHAPPFKMKLPGVGGTEG